MTDITIRRIVWYALLTALLIQAFGLKAQITPCAGKTASEAPKNIAPPVTLHITNQCLIVL